MLGSFSCESYDGHDPTQPTIKHQHQHASPSRPQLSHLLSHERTLMCIHVTPPTPLIRYDTLSDFFGHCLFLITNFSPSPCPCIFFIILLFAKHFSTILHLPYLHNFHCMVSYHFLFKLQHLLSTTVIQCRPPFTYVSLTVSPHYNLPPYVTFTSIFRHLTWKMLCNAYTNELLSHIA